MEINLAATLGVLTVGTVMALIGVAILILSTGGSITLGSFPNRFRGAHQTIAVFGLFLGLSALVLGVVLIALSFLAITFQILTVILALIVTGFV